MREHLATFVERHGSQIAVVTYPGNRRKSTSYGQLATLAGRFSRLLAERGIAPGDRVLLWGRNSAEWIAAFFGCVLRGVIAVPLDANGSVEFATRVLADTSPRLIAGDPELLRKLPDSISKTFFNNFDSVLPREPLLTPEPSLNLETPLQILFTAGTTSDPKGIVHTHGNVLASVEVLEREIQKYLRYERWVHPLRMLHTLPLSHVFGQFMGLWIAPLLAAPVHYEDQLAAGHLIARIHRERISVAVVVPRVLELMRGHLLDIVPNLPQRLEKIRRQKIWWRWWHLRDVHRKFGFKFWAFVCGGATLPPDLEQFWNTLGLVLVQGYGMTETTALATLNHPFRTAHGTIGKPLAGREVRVTEDGEILVRGAMLAEGIWRDGHLEPRSGEWLHTGDLGSMDASGDVRFLGRKSDVIVAASGMNIHPADLEIAVQTQSGVRECVVVGWEGPRGAEPVAVVLLDRQIVAEEESRILGEILREANRRLQEFQQIHSVLRWPETEFPRNSVGKLLRREVSDWVRQQLQAKSSAPAMQARHDPLLLLLEQVTGESIPGLDDSADLATSLHLDSLGRMQLAMGMEEHFDVAIDDNAITAAKTLGDLRKLLQPRIGDEREALPSAHSASKTDLFSVSKETEIQRRSRAPNLREAYAGANLPKYVRWPWNGLVQAVRVVFLECILRPLVALLGHPHVVRDNVMLPDQPSIYVCNHVTVIDAALVLYALPGHARRHMAIAMSAELLTAWRHGEKSTGLVGPLRWLGPLLAFLVTALFNAFPLPVGAGLRQSFAYAGEALDRGYNVLVFPEGRRTRTGELQPFQTGISLLTEKTGTAVVPMALVGLWEAAKHREFLPKLRPCGLAVVIGSTISRTVQDSHARFAESLHSAVAHLISMGMKSESV